MYHVSAQGVDERMTNIHYYYSVFVNQWAANAEKQDKKRSDQFGEFSGQGEQRYFEYFSVCL